MADVEEEGSYASQLHFAVKQNDVKWLRSLVEEDSSKVTSRDAVGRTPLHWALTFGNEEAAKVLILNMSKSSLDARDHQGCTPLHYAAARDYATLARVLIMRGASLDAVDAKLRTPLHYAAQQLSPAMVELLVSRGADRAKVNVNGELPVDVALKWGALSSMPCLAPPQSAAPTTTQESVESSKTVAVEAKTSPKKGPSLEKLLSAWKTAELETRRKEEAELAAAHKANAVLEEALRAWREVEQAKNPQKIRSCFKDVDFDQTEKASTSKPFGVGGLSVDTGAGSSSCGETSNSSISCSTQKRDLSWCTEWEAQKNVADEASAAAASEPPQSPRERKLLPNPWKEEVHPWVQVPTMKQTTTLDYPNFDNSPKLLRRSNSFDGSHFLIHIGGLATKLPFMSCLEVY